MARYNVGEKLIVIQFKTGQNNKKVFGPNIGIPLMFEVEDEIEFVLVELNVTEHHKVPNQWDETNTPTCDGFILSDKSGMVWYNQYPKAEYGQVSDAGDRTFYRVIFTECEKPYVESKNVPIYTRLLTDYMFSLYKGLENDDPSMTKARNELFKQIEDKLLKDFNLELKLEPVFKNEPELTDIKCFTLVEKQTQV